MYICADGVQSMVGRASSFIAHTKLNATRCTSRNYIIHGHASAARKTPGKLNAVLHEGENVVNFKECGPLIKFNNLHCTV
jgi:hypothetical protein